MRIRTLRRQRTIAPGTRSTRPGIPADTSYRHLGGRLKPPPVRSRRSLWARRLLAMSLPFLLLTAIELLASDERPPVHPLFEKRGDGARARLHTVTSNLWTLAPGELAAVKPPGTVRIFLFGGSTAYGYPFANFNARASLAGMLEARLSALHPGRRFEILSLGSPGMDSHWTAGFVERGLGFHPDAAIVYTGHNEFLPMNLGVARWAVHFDGPMLAVIEWVRGLASYRWLEGVVLGSEPPRIEIHDVFVHDRMIGRPVATEETREWVEASFERNLAAIRDECAARHVPLILCEPAANVSDWGPNVSVHRPGLDEVAEGRWNALFAEGRQAVERGEPQKALDRFRDAAALDADVAELHYQIGRVHARAGRTREAREAFVRARDLDGHPLRATSTLLDIVQRSAVGAGVALVETEAVLEAASPDGLIGYEVMCDNVHPDLRGMHAITTALLAHLESAGLPEPGPWDWSRDLSLEQVLSRLEIGDAVLSQSYAEAAFYLIRNIPSRYDPLDRVARAESYLRRSLDLDPTNYVAVLYWGGLRLFTGQPEEARRYFRQAEQMHPGALRLIPPLASRSPYFRSLLNRYDVSIAPPD